jgi:hypothetical protein
VLAKLFVEMGDRWVRCAIRFVCLWREAELDLGSAIVAVLLRKEHSRLLTPSGLLSRHRFYVALSHYTYFHTVALGSGM